MPSLGADMERGTVLEWRVRPGDAVYRGDIVAVIDTDKSDIEVEVFEDGVIERIVVPVGEEVEVGALLATIAGATDAVAVPTRPEVHLESEMLSPLVRHCAEELHVDVASLHGSGPGGLVTRADVERASGTPGRVRASPLARRRARDADIDLASAHASGPGGAVVAADLPLAPRPNTPHGDAAKVAVGRLMERAKHEIPHYYLTLHVDLSVALAWLDERNRTAQVAERILPAAMLLRATAIAATEVDGINGWWRDGGYEPHAHVDLGVAVARRGGGLVAPAIVGADRLTLPALMEALTGIIGRAKAGRLRASEMGEPSLTVTSLGDGGADSVIPVIYPPQVAMVGIGRIAERPWADGGMVGARRTVVLSLAADHRVTSGHDGSRFLRAIERLLHQPEVL